MCCNIFIKTDVAAVLTLAVNKYGSKLFISIGKAAVMRVLITTGSTRTTVLAKPFRVASIRRARSLIFMGIEFEWAKLLLFSELHLAAIAL